MKNIFKYLYGILGIILVACTPKTAKVVEDTADKTMEQVAEVAQTDFRSVRPEPGAARPIKLGEAEQFNLVNGLKVIVVENHKVPRISYQLFIDRDPILEGDKAGYVSITGQLLGTGTTTKTKAEIDEAVDFVGGTLSTNSRGGFISSLKKHSGQMLEIFSDVIFNAQFEQSEFDKIKNQTMSGLAAQKEDPNAIAQNVSAAVNYGVDHVYGELETEQTIGNISLGDCEQYYQDYFKPSNAYLVIVGDITSQEAEVQADKYFGQWKGGAIPESAFGTVTEVQSTTIDFVDKAGAVQSVINVTYPVDLKTGSEDFIAANLMNSILGYGGFSGRLFQNIREDKGYTYGAYSSLDSDPYLGEFSAGASVRNEVTDSAITEILYEMERIANEPVSPDELQLAKNIVFGQFARSMEGPQTVARFALNTARFNLPEDYYQTYLEQMEKVTVADIQRVAKKYIRPENAHIVVVGNGDEVLDKLRALRPVRYFDNYGNEISLKPKQAVDIKPEELVNQYLAAIGGRALLEEVKDSYLKMEANVPQMGGAMTMEQYSKDNTKFKMMISTQGMTVQEQVFDGEKMKVSQMGQGQIVTEESALQTAREQAIAFKDLMYFDEGYNLKISGLEQMSGKDVIKMIVTDPNGQKTTEFYDKETGFKVKQISTQEAQGQTVTSTTEYADYQAVDGIKIPHKVTITGAMPVPLTFELKEGSFNQGVSDDLFIIEE